MGNVDMVGDRTGVQRLQDGKWRLSIEDHRSADVLERQPNLLSVRCGGDVRAKRTVLFDTPDDLVIGNRDDDGLWVERRTDVTIFAVRREDLHARTGRHFDPRFLLV